VDKGRFKTSQLLSNSAVTSTPVPQSSGHFAYGHFGQNVLGLNCP